MEEALGNFGILLSISFFWFKMAHEFPHLELLIFPLEIRRVIYHYTLFYQDTPLSCAYATVPWISPSTTATIKPGQSR